MQHGRCEEAEHPRHLGRRHRDHEPELLQRRVDGLPHPEHRPDRRRGDAVHRLLRRAELHRRPRVVHHRPERVPHRPEQGRRARRRRRPAGRGPDDRRAAEAARLRDRAVRQEPSRRPQQVPADRARLRRVLRQPLPPQRRGGARAAGLPEGGRTSRASTSSLHPRGVIHSWATDDGRRRPRTAKYGPRRQAADRGHRPAHQEADGDDRRRDRRSRDRLHRAPARGRHAVLPVDEHHPHAPAHAHQAGEPRPGRALAVAVPRHDDRPRQERRRSCSTRSTSSASPTTRS